MTGFSASPDFHKIRALGAGQNEGFEEFCCQLARQAPEIPSDGEFRRFNGAGGDGGVECVWRWRSGEEWGWQAKYFFELDRGQVDKSVKAALELHPGLSRYFICIPFDLTGPKKGRGGKTVNSQDSQLNELVQRWQALATERRMNVTFVLWSATELLTRLLAIDPSHGRLRYWFGVTQFGEEWFEHQLQDAADAAQPRYTPELNVGVPITAAFDAFGRTPQWAQTIHDLAGRLEKVAEAWSTSYRRAPLKSHEIIFPESHREVGERLIGELRSLGDALLLIPSSLRPETVPVLIDAAAADAELCLEAATRAFKERYPLVNPDSAGWRQHMTEYRVSFPTLHVDRAREVIAMLDEVRAWHNGHGGQLAAASTLLVTGPAGAGKTHAICDVAFDRHRRGLRSVVLFGQLFGDNDPWVTMRDSLGLPGELSRDAMFAALEAAGEASGYPCLIFIDALNETVHRQIWREHLVRLGSAIGRCRWVKLCVSCRSTFRDDVIDPSLKLPAVEHTGFAGVEFDAFREFFAFYGLDIPAMPLMQQEFTNPLFLRLVCESLRDDGQTRLPDGLLGITAVLEFLIAAKETKLVNELNYFPQECLVDRAIAALIAAMSDRQRRDLPWDEARTIVDKLRPAPTRSESLFDALIRENVLTEDRASDPASGKTRPVIRFAFERLADHLIIRNQLGTVAVPADAEDAFRPAGRLHYVLRDEETAREHRGLLEALAIQLPERCGLELPALAGDPALAHLCLQALVDGLAWRSAASITAETQRLLIHALDTPQLSWHTLDAILAVGARPDHPVNADWFHSLFVQLTMPVRDAWWCPYLHLRYGEHKSIDRIIRWACREQPKSSDREVVRLWLTQLAWFCAASDRRVRDHATMGMVFLLEGHIDACLDVLALTTSIDDEYVTERCVAACYAALIRADDPEAIRAVGAALTPLFAGATLPRNAVIRDYLRSIMELGHLREVLPTGATIDQFRPPYRSEWPLAWPDSSIEDEEDLRNAFPRLHESCFRDDFAVYTVPHALRDFDGLDLTIARVWIFQHVLDMGYAYGDLTHFDAYLVDRYGGGRGKKIWAERIGKKYQRIALSRLVARVADHLPRTQDDRAPAPSIPPLLHASARDIDPTLLITKARHDENIPSWWLSADYDFAPWAGATDNVWLTAADWPTATVLSTREPVSGTEWLLLDVHRHWATGKASLLPQSRRLLWMHVRSYLLPRDRAADCMAWLGDGQMYGNKPEQYAFLEGFIGEYPWGPTFQQRIEEFGHAADDTAPLSSFGIVATATSFSPEHELDCYHGTTPNNMTMPAPVFFAKNSLVWNGTGGYLGPDNNVVLQDPALTTPGPSALLARQDFIEQYLREHELALLWIVTVEKLCTKNTSQGGSRLEYTRAYLFDSGVIQCGKAVFDAGER